MADSFGFKSVGEVAPVVIPDVVTPAAESTTVVEPTVENTTVIEPTAAVVDTSTSVAVPEKETIRIDPFADLGNTEKSIFESIKNKDYANLKSILDGITTDYDKVSDIDLVRRQLKDSKPRWSDDMIDTELATKYGLGLDDEELSPQDKLKYKRDLIDAADAARADFKSKQGEIKFPDLPTVEPVAVEAAKPDERTEAQNAEFATYWKGHVENSVKDLAGDVIKIEVGRDGNKEIFDFPISITDADKQSLKTLIDDFDINNDFRTRYVKDNAVDLKKLMSDRFKADNFEKLLAAAFAQGHSKGKLGQIKGDKNLGTSTTNSTSSTSDQVSAKSNSAVAFFGNGKKR